MNRHRETRTTGPRSPQPDHYQSAPDPPGPARRDSILSTTSTRPGRTETGFNRDRNTGKKLSLSSRGAKSEWVSAYRLDIEDLKKWLEKRFDGEYRLPDHNDDEEEGGQVRVAVTEDHYQIIVPRRFTNEEKAEIEHLRGMKRRRGQEGKDDAERRNISSDEEEEWDPDDVAEEDDAPLRRDAISTARKARESGQSMSPRPVPAKARSKGRLSPPLHLRPVSTSPVCSEDEDRPRSRNKPRSPLRSGRLPGSDADDTGNDFSDLHGSFAPDDAAYSGHSARVPRVGQGKTNRWMPTDMQPAGRDSFENENSHSTPYHQEMTSTADSWRVQNQASRRPRDKKGKDYHGSAGDFERDMAAELGGLSIHGATIPSSELHRHQQGNRSNPNYAQEQWRDRGAGNWP